MTEESPQSPLAIYVCGVNLLLNPTYTYRILEWACRNFHYQKLRLIVYSSKASRAFASISRSISYYSLCLLWLLHSTQGFSTMYNSSCGWFITFPCVLCNWLVAFLGKHLLFHLQTNCILHLVLQQSALVTFLATS